MLTVDGTPRRNFSGGTTRKRPVISNPKLNRTISSNGGRRAFTPSFSFARNIIAAESELLNFHHPAAIMTEFSAGLNDSVQLLWTLTFLTISQRVREAFVKLTILNLVLYNGINYLAGITFQGAVHLLEKPELDYDKYKGNVMHVIYLLSILVTSIWYSYLVEHLYNLHGRKVVNQKLTLRTFLRNISQEVWRFIIFGLILPQIHIVGFFPLGIYLKFFAWCLVCGFYSFEYKWKLMNKSLVKRLAMLEDGVFYFTGFGFILTLIATIFPVLLEYGIFPTLLTSNIIIAVVKKPRNLSNSRIRVFYPTNVVITLSINYWRYMQEYGPTIGHQ